MTTANATCATCPVEIAAPARRPPLVVVADLLVGWIQRDRERHMLNNIDDRMLRDIGLDRADVLAEAAKPFWRT